MSKPEAGQWWFPNNVKPGRSANQRAMFVVGYATNGDVIGQTSRDGAVTSWSNMDGWHHEPRCTGWDWVVPEEQPATPSSAEDPDEWVIQDRVPARSDVDKCWCINPLEPLPADPEFMWSIQSNGFFSSKMHGDETRYGTVHVMCRRRDLPKVEQPEQCAVLPENPLQISLGEGRVAITCFSDDTGRGVIFRDTGINHPVGSLTAEPPEASHAPMPGEIYIHCKNKESAIVLIEQMQEVVRQFDAAIEQWPKYYRPVNKATSLVDQKSVAYFRRETRTSGITVHTDGTTFEFNDWECDLVPIVQITEAEAMALLKTPEPQPAKTRVRLWKFCGSETVVASAIEKTGDWQEIHHDAEGFYVEETK